MTAQPPQQPQARHYRKKRSTLASIAAEIGVSRTTVSNAYNHPDELSEQLRQRIFATAERLGYTGPDPMARGLRKNSSGAVGVLFTELLQFAYADPATVEFMAGLAEEIGSYGESMLVIPASSTGQTDTTMGMIDRALVDSFVAYSVAQRDPYLHRVLERGLPTVICDQPTNYSEVPFVGIDDREAIKPAVRHLLELGHRKIGVLCVRLSRQPNDGPVNWRDLQQAQHHVQKSRVEGVLEELAEWGIGASDPDGHWPAVPIVQRHINDPQHNYDSVVELFDAHPDLTAVVCTTDTLALAVLRYAAERGISVPEELSVTGFDGIELARMQQLTTVIQPNREKGRAVGVALREAAKGHSSPTRTILPTTFRIGASTAPPKRA